MKRRMALHLVKGNIAVTAMAPGAFASGMILTTAARKSHARFRTRIVGCGAKAVSQYSAKQKVISKPLTSSNEKTSKHYKRFGYDDGHVYRTRMPGFLASPW
nr:hypothetical protein [Rhodoferax sp.]